jgi:ribosomal protein S18 acetylase RimI-like enzyme
MVESAVGSVSVRVAGGEDIEAVLAVWAEARSAAASTPDKPESVARLIEHTPDALLVAEHDAVIVGVLVAAWDGWRGNMYRLAVLPPYRRRGIARRLVEEGHRRLLEKGAGRVSALVGRGEEDAEALWLSAGYRFDEQIGRFVRNLPAGPRR